jgi:hypothetical protein
MMRSHKEAVIKKYSLSLFLLAALACTAPPFRSLKINGDGGEPRDQFIQDTKRRKPLAAVTVNTELLKAFRSYMYAYYDLHLWRDGYRVIDGVLQARRGKDSGVELRQVAQREQAARLRLGRFMGADQDTPITALLAHFFKSVKKRKDLLLIRNPVKQPIASLHLVSCKGSPKSEESKRELILFEEKVQFRSLAFDEVIVVDFLAYKSQRMGLKPFQAVHIEGTNFYINRAAIKSLGLKSYWRRLDYYEKAEAAVSDSKSFLTLHKKPRNILALAKDGLRGRSLGQLALSYGARPVSVKVTAFFTDYVARAELRAAAEFYQYKRFQEANKRAPKNAAERRWLAELSFYTAMIHGDPRGVLATIFGLAGQQYEQKRALSPQHVAALAITVALTDVKRKALQNVDQLSSEERDARALYELCQSTPKQLREMARMKYMKRHQKSP